MSIQAMKQALEALGNCESMLPEYHQWLSDAQYDLRAAIAEAEKCGPTYMLRELEEHNGGRFVEDYIPDGFNLGIPLYTTPQLAIPAGWQPIDMPLYYKTRCADGTIFLNAVSMPAHAVEWCIAAAPEQENSHD